MLRAGVDLGQIESLDRQDGVTERFCPYICKLPPKQRVKGIAGNSGKLTKVVGGGNLGQIVRENLFSNCHNRDK
jgi:hypothetical protein